MNTAIDVLERIDEEIDAMQREAAGPCIDALVEWTDREAYREATRRAYGLKAVQALRRKLGEEIAAEENGGNAAETPPRRRRAKS